MTLASMAVRMLLLGAFAVMALASVGALAAAPSLLSHRAVYDLSLGRASGGEGSIVRAEGKLEFEWADACTGWTVNQRTRVRLYTVEGEVFDFGWVLSALETHDGRRYRFFLRRLNADGSSEQVRGEARLEGPGEKGLATFSEPEAREVPLPKGTLFPTGHTLLIIEAARQGELPLWLTVFDGSGDEGLFGVNTALSRSLPAEVPPSFKSPLLQGQESWRVHLAYFGMDETVAAPEHEQALRLYANGVVDEMLLDYGDFALTAELGVLEALPKLECKAQ